ncbi:hypothetical protein WJX72_005588 [[Myrmecia] bisecta]|uniref:Uncharacterized protein n=1 Tax=[Myrmecia] bisecta TaxID=41462 RepID=A0AAW1QBM5_9CHLO
MEDAGSAGSAVLTTADLLRHIFQLCLEDCNRFKELIRTLINLSLVRHHWLTVLASTPVELPCGGEFKDRIYLSAQNVGQVRRACSARRYDIRVTAVTSTGHGKAVELLADSWFLQSQEQHLRLLRVDYQDAQQHLTSWRQGYPNLTKLDLSSPYHKRCAFSSALLQDVPLDTLHLSWFSSMQLKHLRLTLKHLKIYGSFNATHLERGDKHLAKEDNVFPPGLLLDKLTLTNEGPLCFHPGLLQYANEVTVNVSWLCPVYTQQPPSLDALVDMLTAGHWSRLELKATAIKSCTPTDMWKVMSDAELAALCNVTKLITELQWCDAEQRARLVLEDCGFQQRHGSTLRVITGVWLAAHASWLSELIPQRYPQLRRLGVTAAHCTAASIPPGVLYCTIQAFRVDVAGLPDTVEELTISRALSIELVHLSAFPKGLKVLRFQQLKTRLKALDLPPDLELDVLDFRDVTSMNLGVLWGLEAKVKRLSLHCTYGHLILASTDDERKECGLWVPDSDTDSGHLLPRICSHLAQKAIAVWELTTTSMLELMFGEAHSSGMSFGSQGTVLKFSRWSVERAAVEKYDSIVVELAGLTRELTSAVLLYQADAGAFDRTLGALQQNPNWLGELLIQPLIKTAARGPAKQRAANAFFLVHAVLGVFFEWANSPAVQVAVLACLKSMLRVLASGTPALLVPEAYMPIRQCIEIRGADLSPSIIRQALLECIDGIKHKEDWQVRKQAVEALTTLAASVQVHRPTAEGEWKLEESPGIHMFSANKALILSALNTARYDKIQHVRHATAKALYEIDCIPDPAGPLVNSMLDVVAEHSRRTAGAATASVASENSLQGSLFSPWNTDPPPQRQPIASSRPQTQPRVPFKRIQNTPRSLADDAGKRPRDTSPPPAFTRPKLSRRDRRQLDFGVLVYAPEHRSPTLPICLPSQAQLLVPKDSLQEHARHSPKQEFEDGPVLPVAEFSSARGSIEGLRAWMRGPAHALDMGVEIQVPSDRSGALAHVQRYQFADGALFRTQSPVKATGPGGLGATGSSMAVVPAEACSPFKQPAGGTDQPAGHFWEHRHPQAQGGRDGMPEHMAESETRPAEHSQQGPVHSPPQQQQRQHVVRPAVAWTVGEPFPEDGPSPASNAEEHEMPPSGPWAALEVPGSPQLEAQAENAAPGSSPLPSSAGDPGGPQAADYEALWDDTPGNSAARSPTNDHDPPGPQQAQPVQNPHQDEQRVRQRSPDQRYRQPADLTSQPSSMPGPVGSQPRSWEQSLTDFHDALSIDGSSLSGSHVFEDMAPEQPSLGAPASRPGSRAGSTRAAREAAHSRGSSIAGDYQDPRVNSRRGSVAGERPGSVQRRCEAAPQQGAFSHPATSEMAQVLSQAPRQLT